MVACVFVAMPGKRLNAAPPRRLVTVRSNMNLGPSATTCGPVTTGVALPGISDCLNQRIVRFVLASAPFVVVNPPQKKSCILAVFYSYSVPPSLAYTRFTQQDDASLVSQIWCVTQPWFSIRTPPPASMLIHPPNIEAVVGFCASAVVTAAPAHLSKRSYVEFMKEHDDKWGNFHCHLYKDLKGDELKNDNGGTVIESETDAHAEHMRGLAALLYYKASLLSFAPARKTGHCLMSAFDAVFFSLCCIPSPGGHGSDG